MSLSRKVEGLEEGWALLCLSAQQLANRPGRRLGQDGVGAYVAGAAGQTARVEKFAARKDC